MVASNGITIDGTSPKGVLLPMGRRTVKIDHAGNTGATNEPQDVGTTWVRASAIARRYGCSTSQAHRICRKLRVRRCTFGGTGDGSNGSSASSGSNAMVLYALADLLDAEQRHTVTLS